MQTIAEENDVSLSTLNKGVQKIWKVALKKIGMLLVLSLLGGAIGYLIGHLSVPTYNARMKFIVQEEDKSSPLSSYTGIASQLGISMPDGGSDLFKSENIIELMKSNLIIDQTLFTEVEVNDQKILLGNLYLKINKVTALRPDHSVFTFQKDRHPERFEDSMLAKIEVDLVRKDLQQAKVDNNVTIRYATFSSKNEAFSKLFLENLMRNVGKYYISTKTEQASNNVRALQKQTDSVKRILFEAMGRSAESADYTLNMNPARQVGQVPLQKNKIDLQIQTSTYLELVKNLDAAKLTLLKETPLFQIIDPPRYPLEKHVIRKAYAAVLGFTIFFLISLSYFYRRSLRSSRTE